MRRASRFLSYLVLVPVTLYQRVISPFLPPACRYYPSCSEYMKLAVKENGPVVGFAQGVLRLLRCNPFFPGGVDFPKKVKRVRIW
ncbi:MAG: membrane protein insertion efficiency factor YidD [Deltaproteobacteria bacterium]|nr:MAG: membrane protein insertion efficiency factor YidD [Deltaproteobacteria bacterium]